MTSSKYQSALFVAVAAFTTSTFAIESTNQTVRKLGKSSKSSEGSEEGWYQNEDLGWGNGSGHGWHGGNDFPMFGDSSSGYTSSGKSGKSKSSKSSSKSSKSSCTTGKSGKGSRSGNCDVKVETSFDLLLVQDHTKITSHDVKQLEHVVYQFLMDNVGGKDIRPVEVEIVGAERGGDRRNVESDALRVEVDYLASPDYLYSVEDEDEPMDDDTEFMPWQDRRLQGGRCTGSAKAKCRSNCAINNGKPSRYCRNQGCRNSCRRRRRNVRDRRLGETHLPDLTGRDFTDVVNEFTNFQPKEASSVLEAEDTQLVAICGAFRFAKVEEGEDFPCSAYKHFQCSENEDLIFKSKSDVCDRNSPTTGKNGKSGRF